MATKTLRELLASALEAQDESEEDILAIRVSEGGGYWAEGCNTKSFEELEEYEGNTGYGSQNLPNLYAYTAHRVYFKAHYDGAESVTSLPRNPTDETPEAFGGG